MFALCSFTRTRTTVIYAGLITKSTFGIVKNRDLHQWFIVHCCCRRWSPVPGLAMTSDRHIMHVHVILSYACLGIKIQFLRS